MHRSVSATHTHVIITKLLVQSSEYFHCMPAVAAATDSLPRPYLQAATSAPALAPAAAAPPTSPSRPVPPASVLVECCGITGNFKVGSGPGQRAGLALQWALQCKPSAYVIALLVYRHQYSMQFAALHQARPASHS